MLIAIILAISTITATASKPGSNMPAPQFHATNAIHTTGEYKPLTEYTCGEGAVARQTTKHCEQ